MKSSLRAESINNVNKKIIAVAGKTGAPAPPPTTVKNQASKRTYLFLQQYSEVVERIKSFWPQIILSIGKHLPHQ